MKTKITKKLFSLICALTLILSLLAGCSSTTPSDSSSDNTDSQATELTEVSDYLIDPDIDPMDLEGVAYLSGSWYEMGQQYGELCDYGVKRTYLQMGTQMLDNLDGDTEQLYEIINGYMDETKAVCPDLYDFVTGVDEAIEELDFVQCAIGTVCENAYVDGSMSMTPGSDECETISAWGSATSSGHLLAATNGDTLIDYTFHHYHPVIVMFPDDGHSVLGGTGASSNALMNDQGVLVLSSGGQQNRDDDVYEGNASFWATIYALAYSDSADEMLDKFQNDEFYHPVHGNTHVVDTTGTAGVYENTASHASLRMSGDFGETDYLIANNGYLTDEMQSSLVTDGTWDDCPVRYATVEQIIKENFGNVTIGYMHEAIASRRYYLDGEWSDINWSLGDDTFYSSDSSFANDKTTVRTLIDATELTFYRQLGSSDPYNNSNPDATSRFFKLVMSESPYTMTNQANRDAQILIWYASRDLSTTPNHDEALDENLNTAKDYLQQGASYGQMARMEQAEGNTAEANILFSKATSAFCLAQEYAQNAMIEDNTYTAIDGESYTR